MEEAGGRLLRASQGVWLIVVRLASKASQESLHSLGPFRNGEHGRDQSKHRSMRLGVLSFYGHIGEDEAGRANEMATDRQSIISVPDLKPPSGDEGLSNSRFSAPTMANLEDVLSISEWNIEPPLHPQHLEVDGERKQDQGAGELGPKHVRT